MDSEQGEKQGVPEFRWGTRGELLVTTVAFKDITDRISILPEPVRLSGWQFIANSAVYEHVWSGYPQADEPTIVDTSR